MSMSARHWLATVPGVTDEVSDDAYLWLDHDATGQHGQLWVVADGHGPAEACALASAVVVHTIADEYPELIAELGAPFAAMIRCMEIASERVRTMATAQEALNGMSASCAAIAEYDGLVWAVSVGTARAYLLRGGTLERVSTDQVSASHIAADDMASSRLRQDSLVVGALGSERPSIVPCAGGPIEPEGAAFLLATEGTWRALTPELMIGALERMQPRTAVDAMLEVGLMKFADCAMTACVIRYSALDIRRVTGRAQFLAWAAGDAVTSAAANKTLMLDPEALVDHGAPTEHLHPTNLPDVQASPNTPMREATPTPNPASEPPVIERTALFSLQDIQTALAREQQTARVRDEATGGPQTVDAAAQEGSPTDRHAPITSVGAAVRDDREETTAFSPQDVREVIARAAASDAQRGSHPLSTDQTANATAGGSATAAAEVSPATMAFSPQDLASIRAAMPGREPAQDNATTPSSVATSAPGTPDADARTTLEEEPIEHTTWLSPARLPDTTHRPSADPDAMTVAPTRDAPAISDAALRSETIFGGTGGSAPSGPPPSGPPPSGPPPGGLYGETVVAGTGQSGAPPTSEAPRVGGDVTLMEPSRPHFRSQRPQPSDTKTTPRKKPHIADPFTDRWDGRETSGDSDIVPYKEGGGMKRVLLFVVVVGVASGLGFLGARYLFTLL